MMVKKIVAFLFLTIGYLSLTTGVLAAASLSLSPASSSTAQGQTFIVNVVLNTDNNSSSGTDALLSFNPQIIKIQSVAFANPLLYSGENRQTIDNTNGKLTLNSSVISAAYAYKGSGTLATITFKGESTGSSAVSFLCTAATTNGDSNIWNTQAQDIINCSSNIGGAYTVTSGESTSPTATPTITSGGESDTNPTATPTPPAAGNISLTIFPVIVGGLLLLFGLTGKFLFLKT